MALALALRAAAPHFAPVSDDLKGWWLVAESLREGANPYETTTRLNWPPPWMLWIGLGDSLARVLSLPFAATLRLLPFAADLGVVLVLLRLRPSAGLLYAVHPVALTTTGAQAQFDSVPALAVLLAVCLARPAGAWRDVAVGLCLAAGAAFKTWPLLLAPALAWAFPGWPQRLRLGLTAFLGWALALLPVAALSPAAFRANVLGYASYPGWWGLTSLGIVIPLEPFVRVAAFAHAQGRILLLAGLLAVWLTARRLPASEAALATLLAFLVLTPGFGPQYLLWVLPLACLERGPLPTVWHLLAGIELSLEFFVLPRLPSDPTLTSGLAALAHNQLVNALRFPLWVATIGWLGLLLFRRRP